MTLSLTGGVDDLSGRVGGAVLATIRAAGGHTQEALAEQLRASLSTVQAWESGRRPLVRATFQTLQRLNCCLRFAGTSSELLYVFDQALQADAIYADIAGAALGQHPFALIVPDRTLTELLAWPLTGTPPRQLRTMSAQLYVPTGVRDAVAADLREAADRCAHDEHGTMVRRQVKFLLAEHAPSAEWLRVQMAADLRAHTDLRSWSPQWPVIRSQAVSAARSGNLDPLRHFIDQGLTNDAGIDANLRYWAYWVGEHSAPWTADIAMIDSSIDWFGDRLLKSLVDGVVHAPYRELCIHTLWVLLRHRRHLIRHDNARRSIITAAEVILSTMEVDAGSRQRLEQVRYLVESAG